MKLPELTKEFMDDFIVLINGQDWTLTTIMRKVIDDDNVTGNTEGVKAWFGALRYEIKNYGYKITESDKSYKSSMVYKIVKIDKKAKEFPCGYPVSFTSCPVNGRFSDSICMTCKLKPEVNTTIKHGHDYDSNFLYER